MVGVSRAEAAGAVIRDNNAGKFSANAKLSVTGQQPSSGQRAGAPPHLVHGLVKSAIF